MLRFRPALVSRPRAVLLGTVVLFAGVQLALALFLTRTRPELRDPEYGSLLQTLQARVAEAPGNPLVLILGSSRSANLFRPLPPGRGTAAGPDPLVFNFGTLQTGPLRELQMLRRLLAQGVRPHWVLAELWPPYLTGDEDFVEEKYIRDRDLQIDDAALVRRYFADPWPAYGKLAEGLLAPAFSHRSGLLAAYSPFVDRPAPRQSGDWSDPSLRVEGFGWLPAPEKQLPPERFRGLLAGSALYLHHLLADFRVCPVADRALRELLDRCARHGIRTALVLLPEHSAVRACYPPETLARLSAYLEERTRACQTPVIDTRDWVSDDDFIDARHTLPQAAAPYTERFQREVLRPLLQGMPVNHSLRPGTSASPLLPSPAH